MKTQFTSDSRGNVTIKYDDALRGCRVTREFFVRGSYVYESDDRGDKQVCFGLESRGPTLTAPDGKTKLIDVIRSEYRDMRSAERKELARNE